MIGSASTGHKERRKTTREEHVMLSLKSIITAANTEIGDYVNFENINIKLKEWMSSENFVQDFSLDYYHCCENFENFIIGYDRNGDYSHYYKYECSKFKNELQRTCSTSECRI